MNLSVCDPSYSEEYWDRISLLNKHGFLEHTMGTRVKINLDDDLVPVWQQAGGQRHKLTPTDVLLIQVLRLLRPEGGDGSGSASEPEQPTADVGADPATSS